MDFSSESGIDKFINEKKLPNINDKIMVIINILEVVKEIIKATDTDFIWTGFDSEEEIINELDHHILKLKMEDFSEIEDLIVWFLPTADIQEISLSSGWNDQYLFISEIFDKAIKDLNEKFNLKIFKNS